MIVRTIDEHLREEVAVRRRGTWRGCLPASVTFAPEPGFRGHPFWRRRADEDSRNDPPRGKATLLAVAAPTLTVC